VEETIPDTIPACIAPLRLDADWYSSTEHKWNISGCPTWRRRIPFKTGEEAASPARRLFPLLGDQANHLTHLVEPCNSVSHVIMSGMAGLCMASLPTFCFVIPCFNEDDNVGATVGSVREAMGSRGDYEIVLINDASTDRTLERMQALAAAD